MKQFFIYISLLLPLAASATIQPKIDYATFLSQHDMRWDSIPHRWEVAPYSGNGNIGFLLYKDKSDPANAISLHLGRHDYYDHRLPIDGDELLWIYRGRLPLGRFQIITKGSITDCDLRLSLHRAELTGTITTEQGTCELHALTHSTHDSVYLQTAATNESITIKWIPEVPFSSSRRTLDAGGGPKSKNWDVIRNAPYPVPPKATFGENDGINHCQQILHDHRGETTTTWKIKGDPTAQQTLTTSVHHSFPEKNSLQTATANLQKSHSELTSKTYFSSHYQWWSDYYPQSFLTLDDPEKEAFYWIQMYKLGSAMRENGPILDLMGPWYHYTFWPMVWGDLNVQLQYWTHLTSNRLSLGESLPNNLDKYQGNLLRNTPAHWKDSASISTCFPQDMLGSSKGKTPDMLVWILHNYWLHCQFAADDARLRDKFFPILRQSMNSYLNWLKDSKKITADGKIDSPLTLPKSWSPEYPGPWDENCNFTIGLIRWCGQTLLDLNKEYKINDPLVPQWRALLNALPDFETDKNGLRVSKNVPFEKPHRHYSHLLPFYPLAVLTPDTTKGKALLKTTLDHWLKVTRSGAKKAGNGVAAKQTGGVQAPSKAMPVTGYTATGAASIYAWLQDSENAHYYLDFLIKHQNVSPTTMYAEGNPVIESPLSFCTALHDMLLQSWGRKTTTIRVLPAAPKEWPNLAFHQLRTQGAFLVSAKRKNGKTQFVTIKSLAGKTCTAQIDIPKPHLIIDGTEAEASADKNGNYILNLKKGQTATFTAAPIGTLSKEDLTIAPIPVPEKKQNLFGYSKKTKRLPSHKFYGKAPRK